MHYISCQLRYLFSSITMKSQKVFCFVNLQRNLQNWSYKSVYQKHFNTSHWSTFKIWWLTAFEIIIWQHNMSFLSMHMKSGNRINSIRICGSQTIPFIRKRKQKLNSFWLFSHSHQKVNLRVAIILKGC